MSSYQVLNDLIWYIMEINLQHGDTKLPWSIVKQKIKFKILNRKQNVKAVCFQHAKYEESHQQNPSSTKWER